jgi:SOS-response transcriptional repressor LexA
MMPILGDEKGEERVTILETARKVSRHAGCVGASEARGGGDMATDRSKALGRYIADRRRELGLTQMDLARSLHLSQATISSWENGEVAEVTIERLGQFAQVLRVDREEIAQRAGLVSSTYVPYYPRTESGETRTRRPSSTAYDAMRDALSQMPFPVPVVTDVRAFAGMVRGGPMETSDYVWMPPNYLARRSSLLAFRIGDTSMAPAISRGDHVVVDTDVGYAVGAIIVAVVDDQFVCRRVKKASGITILLEGDNDGGRIVLPSDEAIVGKVITVTRSLE